MRAEEMEMLLRELRNSGVSSTGADRIFAVVDAVARRAEVEARIDELKRSVLGNGYMEWDAIAGPGGPKWYNQPHVKDRYRQIKEGKGLLSPVNNFTRSILSS